MFLFLWMCLLDMSPEISFEAGGEATLITVELDVLVPRLDMLLQLVGDGGPVAAVRAGEALSVLGDHVPPEDLGRTALVAALVLPRLETGVKYSTTDPRTFP